ncbi:phosphoglycerate mutase-like protein [Gyrodon lividus]|nr:phosphoglycerate mutase-like protein [Gyrodon lividus]
MHYQTILNTAFLTYLGFQTSHSTNNDVNNLGNLSPYHPAPQPDSVKAELPSDCKVEQVVLLHRHGSRGPSTSDSKAIRALVNTLGKPEALVAIHNANLSAELRFLKEGYKYDLVEQELTVIGRQQLFNHGAEFTLQYPKLTTDVILSTTLRRVIDSAHFFAWGNFGRVVRDDQFKTVDDLGLDVNWLSPWDACPKYGSNREAGIAIAHTWVASYIPPITTRLNALLPGVNLSDEDTHGALLACPYDLAAGNKSPWCDVFLPDELRDFEYEMDLEMYGSCGFGLPNNMGPLLGSVYVNELIERLTNAKGDAKELYLEFAHDSNIVVVLAAMGLNKDTPPLSPDHIRPDRKFRTSQQTPFAAQMIWEKFTCEHSFEGPQVRLLLNDATYPLSICGETAQDKEYGTCSVAKFVTANAYSANIHYGDATWNATCGH